ncbi:MAG: glucose-1-phosphate cytidylyltransferase [Alphaproteobacteria bacterium]|nr:glucose-1-phosphate cytidylyltransferase [Alphaproteobacteria bacterium]
MKAVILAGGYGTRITEESVLRPKPMVEIGGRPILWHIMKIYAAHGITDFIVCLGYKGYVIKEYFANYVLHAADVTIDLAQNRLEYLSGAPEPWKVTLVETGEATETGGRLKRVARWLQDDDTFCMTYGDGVSDIDITASLAFHRKHGKLATMAAVTPPGRFGALTMEGDSVTGFREKPRGDGGLINGGFFVLSRQVLDYVTDDKTVWERAPLEKLATEGQLEAFRHDGFWQPMDTVRERMVLESLWNGGKAPWKVWA